MRRVSPKKLRHELAVSLLWKTAKEKLYERFGENPPEILLKQLATDRRTWKADDIEISAFLGKLTTLAAENGWVFQVQEGFYDCLVPYLFGAIPEPPKDIDGNGHWPMDCICSVGAEIFERLSTLFREAFDKFYVPVRICLWKDSDPSREQTWTLLPKDEPIPYGLEPYGEWDPPDHWGGKKLIFRLLDARKPR